MRWHGTAALRQGWRRASPLALAACSLLAAGVLPAPAEEEDAAALPAEVLTPRPARHYPLATAKAVFLDLARAGERLVAVGERGVIAWRDPGGSQWRQAEVPVDVTLTAVAFTDPRHGWAVGHQTTILRTDDGGAHWALVRFDPAANRYLLAVRFLDRRRGFVLGSDGTLIATDDGGATWSEQILRVEDWYENHLFDLVTLPSGRALIAAEKGVLYRSARPVDRPSAMQWAPLPSPYDGSWFGAARRDHQVLLFGMRGHLYRTTDEGGHFTAIPTGTEEFLLDAAPDGFGNLLIAGLGGMVVRIGPEGAITGRYRRPDREDITALLVTGETVHMATMRGGVEAQPLAALFGGDGD